MAPSAPATADAVSLSRREELAFIPTSLEGTVTYVSIITPTTTLIESDATTGPNSGTTTAENPSANPTTEPNGPPPPDAPKQKRTPGL